MIKLKSLLPTSLIPDKPETESCHNCKQLEAFDPICKCAPLTVYVPSPSSERVVLGNFNTLPSKVRLLEPVATLLEFLYTT